MTGYLSPHMVNYEDLHLTVFHIYHDIHFDHFLSCTNPIILCINSVIIVIMFEFYCIYNSIYSIRSRVNPILDTIWLMSRTQWGHQNTVFIFYSTGIQCYLFVSYAKENSLKLLLQHLLQGILQDIMREQLTISEIWNLSLNFQPQWIFLNQAPRICINWENTLF